MKFFTNQSLFLSFLIIVSFLLITSCKDEVTEPKVELDIDQELVGTWELTKIVKPFPTTPEVAGISLTAIFNQDATLKFTTINIADTSTTIDIGVWSTSDTVLTVTLEGDEPKSSPYLIKENIAIISDYSVLFNGTSVLATLEFTKQP